MATLSNVNLPIVAAGTTNTRGCEGRLFSVGRRKENILSGRTPTVLTPNDSKINGKKGKYSYSYINCLSSVTLPRRLTHYEVSLDDTNSVELETES